MPAAPLRFGLAANRLHHESPDAALFTWLRACSSTIRELGVQLHTWAAPTMPSCAKACCKAIPA